VAQPGIDVGAGNPGDFLVIFFFVWGSAPGFCFGVFGAGKGKKKRAEFRKKNDLLIWGGALLLFGFWGGE